jgi:hypothetical protein
MKPAMLERAIENGDAPILQAIRDRGAYVDDCVAAFPSVTPVCAASIATGTGPDAHQIPSMNWFSRAEGRYVEYGSSFSASLKFGVVRSLTDTVYRMNNEHLSAATPTVFELLDDAAVRTAGTTYLMYRGRYEHSVTTDTPLARIASATVFRQPVMGPRELFYADLFASRRTGCRGQFGMPGARDAHTGCVGAYLEEHDLYDFMLFSLPDNDTFSHRNGTHAQVTSIAAADKQLARLVEAGGGLDRFLDEHAMIVMADHSHAQVEERIRLNAAFDGWSIARPDGGGATPGDIAISPAQRSAMVYVLAEEQRSKRAAEVAKVALAVPGVDLAMRRAAAREGVIESSRGELHFAPGGDLVDLRGRRWSIDGDLETIGARIEDGRLLTPDYPDALARVWSSLTCETSGDVLLSAAPAYEFVDWGGSAHVGAGSHGSLHRSDSLAPLLWCGTGPETRDAREQWTLRDVMPMAVEHFGVEPSPAALAAAAAR